MLPAGAILLIACFMFSGQQPVMADAGITQPQDQDDSDEQPDDAGTSRRRHADSNHDATGHYSHDYRGRSLEVRRDAH